MLIKEKINYCWYILNVVPIKRENFYKNRTDKYMETRNFVYDFLLRNKENAYTTSEILDELGMAERELLQTMLAELRKEGKIDGKLISDGKGQIFYYTAREREAEPNNLEDETS